MRYLKPLMDQNFLEYASYVIKDRAIPDIMDGLKPVQRRILHTMKEMDDGKFSKVANIVGDTMKLHPHGDASIGSALILMANKEYFIEKQGNFGNQLNIYDIVISGGVIANKRFRDKLNKINQNDLYKIKFPNIKYCTDNAAMICMAGYEKALNKQFSSITFDAKPNQLMNDNES